MLVPEAAIVSRKEAVVFSVLLDFLSMDGV